MSRASNQIGHGQIFRGRVVSCEMYTVSESAVTR